MAKVIGDGNSKNDSRGAVTERGEGRSEEATSGSVKINALSLGIDGI